MGPYLSPLGTDEGFCAGVGDTQRGHGVGGGGTPARYLIRSNTSSALVLWKQTPACFETPLPDG